MASLNFIWKLTFLFVLLFSIKVALVSALQRCPHPHGGFEEDYGCRGKNIDYQPPLLKENFFKSSVTFEMFPVFVFKKKNLLLLPIFYLSIIYVTHFM